MPFLSISQKQISSPAASRTPSRAESGNGICHEDLGGQKLIAIITGASHTGKTLLSQKLLEKYHYPYLSLDLLKMGLIRSRNTSLTPEDDRELTSYLWPIVREMIKTAVENRQNLIVEGCYIPSDWKKDFSEEYLKEIRYCCLVMSKAYIERHFSDIKEHAGDIEKRIDDTWCTKESVLKDNAEYLEMCREHGYPYLLIDSEYKAELDLQQPDW